MIILMADIVGSSKQKGDTLMKDFKKAVAFINDRYEKKILSPLTITLGDEFQGVVKDAPTALQAIFDLEAYIMNLKAPFQLRFVIQEGEIQTNLNRLRAHEMLGPGLTEARSHLLEMKTSKRRYLIQLENRSLSETLNKLFVVLQGIVDRWTLAQQRIVVAFLELEDYRKVAKKLKKDPSTIWRRKRSVMMEEYTNLRTVMVKLAGGHE